MCVLDFSANPVFSEKKGLFELTLQAKQIPFVVPSAEPMHVTGI